MTVCLTQLLISTSRSTFSTIKVICQHDLDSLTPFHSLCLVDTTMPVWMFSCWCIFCFELASVGIALVPNDSLDLPSVIMTKGRLRLSFNAGKIALFSIARKNITQVVCNHLVATGRMSLKCYSPWIYDLKKSEFVLEISNANLFKASHVFNLSNSALTILHI